MRFKLAVAVLLAAFFSAALTSSANGVPAKSRSGYGGTLDEAGLTTITSGTPIDGFTPELVCPNSDFGGGVCSDPSDLILAIVTPNLPSGTLINITGAGEVQGVYCAGSFFGDCTALNSSDELITQLSAAQTDCVNGINETFDSGTGTDQISVPSCALATSDGTSMTFLFANFSSIPTLQISSAVPEPGSVALLGIGLLGLWSRRRRTV